MQNTSTLFKKKIKEASRQFQCKVTIGDRIYNNDDVVDIIIEHPQPADGFTIGNTPSKTLDLTILNKGDTIYSANQVKVEIGINTGTTIEYILMGYFNIDDIEKTDYTTKITSYDNMIKFETPYFSNLTYPATLQQVVNELAAKTGVQFTGGLPSYTVKKLEGFTCREVLGFVAGVCGGNAAITREGKFTVIVPREIEYSIEPSNYFDLIKLEETKYKVGKITCKAEDKELIKGSLGTDSMEIQFENPWVTESILQDLYNKLNGFSYLGYSMKWQGDISLDYGDIVTVTDKKGVARKHPILSQKFNYTGGLTSEIGAKGESKNKNSYNSSGDNSKKLSRVVTELALVNKAFVDYAHINDADITNLRAKDVEIQNALIEKADVKELKAIDADINNLHAKDAVIDKALIGKADIIDLNAVKADINILDADVGNIKTLTAGNISAENIQTEFLQALKGWMLEGSIGNAQISDLNANKIRSGTVDTSLVTVASKDNSITLTGNQLMVNDTTVPTTPKNRVVLGKYQKADGTWTYGLLVRAEDGQTVMLDGYGVHNAGLTSDAIKDNVVADDANISGNKLDINSVIRSVNGSTEKIESTVVNVGNKTLNVLLQEQTNDITEHGKSLSTHESRITANEKSINLKVDSQTYTSDKTTINKSIETTLTNSKAYADTKKVEAISTAATDAATKANNAKDTAISEAQKKADKALSDSKTYVNQEITTVNSNLSKATSEISVLKGQISLKVEQSDIDKTVTTQINNLEVGGRNLLQYSNDISKYWIGSGARISQNGDVIRGESNSTTDPSWPRILSNAASLIDFDLESSYTITCDTRGMARSAATTRACAIVDGNGVNPVCETFDVKIGYEWQHNIHTFKPLMKSNKNTNIHFYVGDTKGDSSSWLEVKNVKIEKGKIPTDWSPAPEDTVNEINNIKIGGRNYARKLGGKLYDINSIYSGDRQVVSFETINNKTWIKVTNATSLRINSIEIEPNETYTWSFNVYTTGTDNQLYCHQWSSDGAYNGFHHTISNIVTKVVQTFTASATSKYEIFHISSLVNTDTYYFSDFKLEKGDRVTDWSPAPEDVDESIKTVSEKIDTKVADIKITTDAINTNVSQLTIETNRINNVVINQDNRLKSAEEKITKEAIINTVSESITNAKDDAINIAKAIGGGKMLYPDATFKEGINGLSIYNLSGGLDLRMNRVSKISGCPSTSTHCMEMTVAGPDISPDNGGFTFMTQSRPNAIFIAKIRAKIPTGCSLDWHSNNTGIGRIHKWLTPNVGTGEWEEYIHETICGVSGTFETTEFYALSGGKPPFKWYISSATVYDITDNTDIDLRVTHAEQKITKDAIISTVSDAKTNGKDLFAKTSTIEQLNDQVNFKFDSVGSPNVLRNTYFENLDTSGWSMSDCSKYFPNPEVFTPSQGWVAFCMNSNVNRSLFYQFLTGKYILERGCKYTFSLSSITEKNIGAFQLYIDYLRGGTYVYNQQIGLKLGANQTRYGVSFVTPDIAYDEVKFYIDVRRQGGTSGYVVFSIGLPCLCKGASTAYNNRANEVYTGNTRVSADGVTIYNGALTVVNKSGQNVISADSNGDISFRGKLQPNDYQVKLFGNNCQIDGSAGAVRMQLTPQIYVAMDSAGYMRIYNQRSGGGTNYVSLGVNEEGHTILFCGRTMLKLLGGSAPGVQARWGGDGGYCPMQASDFINNSTIKAKTNISSLNIENAINIIKENNIRTYQLKADINNDGLDHEKTLWDSNAPIKTGLIIEELTSQAKDMLVPSDTDCISLYSMVSLLWGVVQNNQNELEKQQEQINNLQRQIDELKKIKI